MPVSRPYGQRSPADAIHAGCQPAGLLSAQVRAAGQNRVTAGLQTALDEQIESIVDELIKIGKDRKPLESKDLTKYRTLLNSQEVLERAPDNADDAQLAKCAAQALEDFITKIEDDGEREAIQAALVTSKKFANKTITSRRPRYLTESTFKRIRTRQFYEIAKFLCGGLPQNTLDASIVVTDTERAYIAYGLDCLARAAVTLHFAGLACLFIHAFDASHKPHEPALVQPDHLACTEHCLLSLLHLLDRANYWRTIPPQARSSTIDSLPPARDRYLTSLIDEVRDCWTLVEGRPTKRQLSFTFASVLGLGGDLYFLDLYSDIWVPWYRRNLPHGNEPAGIELLTAKSGLLSEALYPYCKVTRLVGNALDLAYRALAHYYGRSLHDVIADGRTLQDHAEVFFTDRTFALLKP